MKVTANGKTFTFPDGTSTDDVGDAIDEYFAGQSTPAQSTTQQQQQGVTQEQQGGFLGSAISNANDAVNGIGRSIAGAAVNVANIPAELWDYAKEQAIGQVASSGMPVNKNIIPSAPRASTAELEQSLGASPGALTPQGPVENILAQAIPYVLPGVGQERIASQAPKLASRAADFVANSVGRNVVGAGAQTAGGDGSFVENLASGVAGEGLFAGAGNAAGAVYRGLKGTIAPEAQKAIQFAEDIGAPLHTTDILKPQGKVGKLAQGAAENVPFVGTSGMRATQQEARSKLVEDYAGKFGEYDPSQIISSLKSKTGTIREAAGNRLESVKDQMSGVTITPQKAIDQIDTEIGRMKKLGGVADNETIGKLQAYRDELTKTGTNGPVRPLDMEQLSNLRTQFRQDVKGERTIMPSRSEAAVNRVYNAMTGDLHGAIGTNLGSDTLRKYQQANAIYANEANKLQNTRLKNVLMKGDLTPEVVNNMLFSKNKSEVQNLYQSVGNAGRAQMRNGIIGKAMEKSGGSPDQFLRQLNMLSNQTGIAFKGADAGYIKGLKNYLDATNRAGKAGVTTPTGQQVLPWVVATAAISHPYAAAGIAGYGTISRMYESKPIRNAMLKLANTPRGSSAFERNVQEVMRHVNAMAQGAKSEAMQ